MGISVGYWQSCTGCTESEDGYVNEDHFPPHPKHGVPQGMGCDECKGKGVVFQRWTKKDAEEFYKMAMSE
jgi:hypothetical protein